MTTAITIQNLHNIYIDIYILIDYISHRGDCSGIGIIKLDLILLINPHSET